ncbi:hypothetical protein J4E80_001465 [Alternaria sp. BMP 0032]|nr:hypothetical protein J4E80_001465 [Alternaria sp. BMP 0032]
MGKIARMKRPSEAAQEPVFVIVEVGDTKTKYHIHRSLLVEHSDYFKKASNGPWKEAQEGVVKLEDVECSTFSIFVDWVYTQTLPKTCLEWCDGKREDYSTQMEGKAQLARTKALIFGDRVLSPAFYEATRDSLINHLIKKSTLYEAVIHGFAHLPKDHAILNLFVEKHCRDYEDADDTVENGELVLRSSLPHDFLMRVMIRYSRFKKEGVPQNDVNPCDYHGHANEEEKKQCQAEVDKD